jgi:hypothetical protein
MQRPNLTDNPGGNPVPEYRTDFHYYEVSNIQFLTGLQISLYLPKSSSLNSQYSAILALKSIQTLILVLQKFELTVLSIAFTVLITGYLLMVNRKLNFNRIYFF